MKPTALVRAVTNKPIVARFVGWLTCAFVIGGADGSPLLAQALSELEGAKQICSTGPSARVARAERLRGTAEVTAADVLPNPSLVVEHQRALRGPTDEETVLGISVPLGFSGRRSFLHDAAAARNEQALSDADSTLFESALSFREVYAGAVINRERVVVLQQHQAMLEELSITIAGLTKGGETAEYDLLRQRLHARLHGRTLEFARARSEASLALLEAWLGSKVTLPAKNLLELAGGIAGDGRPIDAATLQHSRLRSLEAEARASGLEARAANRRWLPDLELFAGYRGTVITSDTGHGVALSLRVPLTFFDHGQGEAARARAEQERARASAELLRRQNSARLRSMDSRIDVLSASLGQFEPGLVEAESLLDKARQLYAAGETTITELLETFRAAEEARLGLIDLAEELAHARFERMRAAGTQLDATLDEACSAARGSSP